MSLKRNIIASYASQIYVMVIGIAMVPVYIRYMGIESYGLVGLFVMLQIWFQLLDVGLTPTLSRETARYRGGVVSALALRRFLRLLEVVFVTVACAGGGALALGADFVARQWLQVSSLPVSQVETAIQLMAAVVALRWVSGLYRSAVNGFERLVWLGGFNALAATCRSVLVVPYLIYVGADAADFFTYQLAVVIVELIALMLYAYHLMPRIDSTSTAAPWDWMSMRSTLRFSLGVALTASIWIFVTQTDKLLLSKLLPLTDYAYYSLAVLVASSVLFISAPIGAAIIPRMIRLAAAGDDAGMLAVYRRATQLACVITLPATLMLAALGHQILWAWTGNPDLSMRVAPALALYALGNGILSIASFAYYIQVAKGDLKLHVLGHMLFLVLFVPALVWATVRWGVIGAGYAWLTANAVYLLAWVPAVHRRFFPGLHSKWLLQDIAPVAAVVCSAALIVHLVIGDADTRAAAAGSVAFVAIGLLALAAASSRMIRSTLSAKLRQRAARTA